MVLNCAAYGCTNHNRMPNKPGFFRFPNNNPELRQKWINACKRINKDGSNWNPTTKHLYICVVHFIEERPRRDDPNHPDHVPSRFVFQQASTLKEEGKMHRHQSARKSTAKRKHDEVDSAAVSAEQNEPVPSFQIISSVVHEDVPLPTEDVVSEEMDKCRMIEIINLRKERG